MEPEFLTFRKYNDLALANNFIELLKKHDINYYMEEESLVFNPSFALNNELSKEYAIKIQTIDFDRVNQILTDDEVQALTEVDKDYYLFGFTDDELMEIITKADEWSAFDNLLARKILAERGKNISEAEISNLNKQRINELKTPAPPQTTWIIIGYICGICGGILGIFIGWHLFSYKKTLPDGERVFEYNENDRRHGKRIFYLSIIVFGLVLVYKMTTSGMQ